MLCLTAPVITGDGGEGAVSQQEHALFLVRWKEMQKKLVNQG